MTPREHGAAIAATHTHTDAACREAGRLLAAARAEAHTNEAPRAEGTRGASPATHSPKKEEL